MTAEKKMSSLKKWFLIFLAVLLVFVGVTASFNYERLVRVYNALFLFEEDRIEENFRSMDSMFDAVMVKNSGGASLLREVYRELPQMYTYKGESKKVSGFIKRTGTTGLIVVRDDQILFEEYYGDNNNNSSRFISWSVAKSIVSALIGIAIEEGSIRSIEQSVTDYLPFLSGSGYNGVSIKNVLQMSSGIGFNEDYGDFFSDINRMGRAFAFNSPLKNIILSLENERIPGTYNKYVSTDTQVLGMLLRAATGMSLARYTEKKLWEPAGMEAAASWLVDSEGDEAAFGGFNAVLRDYARFGLIFLNNGYWNGNQIIPEEWVKASVTPDSPHLMPGSNPYSGWSLGYGYQWWIPENPDGDFLAIGIYGQAIYIYPRYNVVIVKTSAYTGYNEDGDEMELESIEFFRSIARNI